MKILALNVGSSSIRYGVYEDEKFLFRGKIDRVRDFGKAIKEIIKQLDEQDIGFDVIGHRIVHGGFVKKAEIISDEVLRRIKGFSRFAPLHNLPEIKVVEYCKRFRKKQIAVYDSVFHCSLPEHVYLYAIPYKFYKKYGIRKIGFHGLSHEYVAENVKAKKIISCHLGAGCSVCAIKNGKSIDTSMGYTPEEGLIMGKRSGDLDPGVVRLLGKKLRQNEECGLKGVCGMSDYRDIRKSKNEKARLARKMFEYRLRKYIGAYDAILDKADIIVFTGAIGENSAGLRKRVSKGFKARVKVVKTDEENVIARKVMEVLR